MSLLAQDERLTRRVGAVTLVLLAAASFFFAFVYHQIEWGKHIRVRVYFTQTGGLLEGAPFIVAGREIGHIESIALSPRGATSPLAGEEGVVVTVLVDRDEAGRVSRDGDVFVTSRGVFSSRFIELGPPPGAPGKGLVDGDQLRGRDPPSIDRVFQRTLENLTITKRFVDEIRPEARLLADAIDQLQATILSIAPEILFVDDFEALIDESKRTYAAIGGDPGVARMRGLLAEGEQTFDQARATIAKLRTSTDALTASVRVLKTRMDSKGAQAFDRIEQAIDRVKAAIDKIDPLLAQVAELQAHITRGDGSLLKLMRDPEFPEDAKELGKILKRQPWKILDRPTK